MESNRIENVLLKSYKLVENKVAEIFSKKAALKISSITDDMYGKDNMENTQYTIETGGITNKRNTLVKKFRD